MGIFFCIFNWCRINVGTVNNLVSFDERQLNWRYSNPTADLQKRLVDLNSLQYLFG